jgi:hypothetical protein
VHCPYDQQIVARARELRGIETVNQLGRTLRLVAEAGLYRESSLKQALGLAASSEVEVALDRPSIEDVFVTLTGRRP